MTKLEKLASEYAETTDENSIYASEGFKVGFRKARDMIWAALNHNPTLPEIGEYVRTLGETDET